MSKLVLLLASFLLSVASGCSQKEPISGAQPAKSEPARREPIAKTNASGPAVVEGAEAYASACVACHQAKGEGIAGMYPPLDGSEWVRGSEERLIAILLYGLSGPLTVKGAAYPGIPMPAFGESSSFNWSDEKIAATLSYVRLQWGGPVQPIRSSRVSEVRRRLGNRQTFTETELLEMP